MATWVGTEDDKLELLQDLIKLDHAAAEAYEEAIERLDNAEYKARLTAFMRDHSRHIEELSPIVRAMGGEVPKDAGAKDWLTEGKVVLSSLMGERAILKAMRSNEEDTNTAYERAVEKAPAEARDIVARGLADERRHRDWILAQLGEAPDATRPRPGARETRPDSRLR